MRDPSIDALNAINRRFYDREAESFARTRRVVWPGWRRLLSLLPASAGAEPPVVIDVGCGDGRFGAFLATEWRDDIVYHGLDFSPAMLALARARKAPTAASYSQVDVLDLPGARAAVVASGQVVAALGLLHHVPGRGNRCALIAELSKWVAPDGLLVATLWCFLDSPRIRGRLVSWSLESTPSGPAEPGDHLVPFGDSQASLRYCHHVDERERAALIEAAGLPLLTEFRADGSGGGLNHYLVLHRPAVQVGGSR